jgi:hypothetical protein
MCILLLKKESFYVRMSFLLYYFTLGSAAEGRKFYRNENVSGIREREGEVQVEKDAFIHVSGKNGCGRVVKRTKEKDPSVTSNANSLAYTEKYHIWPSCILNTEDTSRRPSPLFSILTGTGSRDSKYSREHPVVRLRWIWLLNNSMRGLFVDLTTRITNLKIECIVL